MDKTVALNENEINKLILDINDFSIRVRKIFDEVEALVDETSSYYECNCATKYRNSFNTFKTNFPIMVDNMLTYKKDMQNLKIMFSKQDGVLSNVVSNETKRVQSKN